MTMRITDAALFVAAFLGLFCISEAKLGGVPCFKPAVYTVVNRCNWSGSTHPTDYPANAHWSPLCGVAHNSKVTIVRVGKPAIDGVKVVAETGDCSVLSQSLKFCTKFGLCGAFQEYPCSVMDGTCDHIGQLPVSSLQTHVSLVSMVAPSPDWFVGVGSVQLCKNGLWIPSYERYLNAYDAGSDLGTTFQAPDAPGPVRLPISRFDARDASNIFYNRQTNTLNPLCKITLTLNSA